MTAWSARRLPARALDQGEELYARTPPAERKRFSEIIAAVLGAMPQRLVVMTSQRADYYGEMQANAALFKLTEKIDVPPLGADELELVLREPARALGVGFESDGLIGHVVKSAEDQPGALPLLADLFTDLWERMRERGDGTLRLQDRREIIQVPALAFPSLSGRPLTAQSAPVCRSCRGIAGSRRSAATVPSRTVSHQRPSQSRRCRRVRTLISTTQFAFEAHHERAFHACRRSLVRSHRLSAPAPGSTCSNRRSTSQASDETRCSPAQRERQNDESRD